MEGILSFIAQQPVGDAGTPATVPGQHAAAGSGEGTRFSQALREAGLAREPRPHVVTGVSNALLAYALADQQGQQAEDPLLAAARALLGRNDRASRLDGNGGHPVSLGDLTLSSETDASQTRATGPAGASLTLPPLSSSATVLHVDVQRVSQPTTALSHAPGTTASPPTPAVPDPVQAKWQPNSPQPFTSVPSAPDGPPLSSEPAAGTQQVHAQLSIDRMTPVREDSAPRSTLVRGEGHHGTRSDPSSTQSGQLSALDTDVAPEEEKTSGEQGRGQRRPGHMARAQERTASREIESSSFTELRSGEGARPVAQASPSHLHSAFGSTNANTPNPQPAASPLTPVQPVITSAQGTGPETGSQAGVQSLHLELRPPDIGAVHLRVVLANHTVHTHVTTEQPDLGQYLVARQGQLETAFNSAGMDMGQFRVLIDRHGYGQAGQDSSSQAAQDQQRENRRSLEDHQDNTSWHEAPGDEPERHVHVVA